MQADLVYGGRTAQARTVLVYGNCQAPFLAEGLGALGDLNDDYRFVFVPNHVFPGEQQARPVPEAYLHDVALVLQQYEQQANPAATALRARLPAGCPIITYSSFVMDSFWPFDCPEPRGQSEPGYLWKRYPHGDIIGLRIAQSGLTGPLAVAAYLDLSARKMPNLQVRLQRDIDRMRHYDAHSDVRVGDFVEANFRRQHLFWTNGHLSREAVEELVRRVADAARPILGGNAGNVQACLEKAASPGMGELQLPIHPMVADALDLSFWEPDRTYRWYSQNWTFYEYIEHYIGYDSDW